MRTKVLKLKKRLDSDYYFLIKLIFVITFFVMVIFLTQALFINVYAEEYNGDNYTCEIATQKNVISNSSTFSNEEDSLSAYLITGDNYINEEDKFETISDLDLCNKKYIPNANYFLKNPHHHTNNTSTGLNIGGVCSTVANDNGLS